MALFIGKTYHVTPVVKKRIVVVGINHRVQGHSQLDGGTNEFRNVLECLLEEHSGIQVIFEEWGFVDWVNPGPLSVGNVLANELGLPWENVGTPDRPEFQTTGRFHCPKVSGDVFTYGPIENQIYRENHFTKRIEKIMADRNAGLFVCGLAHLHSMSEKLRRSGFAVEAYEWQPNMG